MERKSKTNNRLLSEKIFIFIGIPLIIVNVIISVRIFDNRLNSTKDQIITTGSRIYEVFQNELRLREHFIKVLSYNSESILDGKITPNEPIQDYFELYQPENGYMLNLLPGYEPSDMGSLTGRGKIPEENSSLYKEISMSVSLTPIFRALIDEDPETPWVYYTSLGGFIYIYPSVAPEDFFFTERLFLKDFIVGALPENNPERQIFWSPVYVDEAGKGLMTTISAPVYIEDKYTGSVSIDLHVDKMKWLLNSYQIESTSNHLINLQGEDLLDDNKHVLDIDPVKISQGEIYRYYDDWITLYSLNTEDWYIMLKTNKSEIIFRTFFDALPVMIILLLSSGSIILVIFIIRANKLLRNSELKFRTFVENANDIIYSLSVDGVFSYVSPNWTDMLGHDVNEVLGKSFKLFVHPDDIGICVEHINTMISIGKTQAVVKYRVKHKDGSYRWHSSTGSPIYDQSGKIISFLGIARDITESKQNEDELKRLVEQKDFLMKELTHRVKNNLLMVSSLISMKNNTIGGQDLSDLINQINAISFIYEKLYQGDHIFQINISEYISDLVSTIFSFSPDVIKTTFNIEINTLSTKVAIPLGLVINEIATNTVKHGILNKSEVLFTVELRKTPAQDFYELILSNTGDPFPEDIDFNNSATLGLRLISELVKQLKGTIELIRTPYPIFRIRFPVEE